MSGKSLSRDDGVVVEVQPRVHLGLISMHAGAIRRNGGIGFAVAAPNARISIRRSNDLQVVDERRFAFSGSEIAQLEDTVRRAMVEDELRFGADVRITGELRTHVGMGSGTALRLGILEGIYTLYSIAAERERLIKRSRRGGTSGVGINTYFSGGLVLDLGIPQDGAAYGPSSRANPTRPPIALPALEIPEWSLCLCVPRSIRPKTQEEEVEFFARTAPLSPEASFRAAYEALFNLYASAAEADYIAFCGAVDAMQRTEWKAKEWYEYGATLNALRVNLSSLGARCVGMSSLGPMLVCFGDPSRLCEIPRHADALDCDVISTIPRNRGRSITRCIIDA
jgi:beta-ribofuranosylaminobenzene 5'-phosphate synthase